MKSDNDEYKTKASKAIKKVMDTDDQSKNFNNQEKDSGKGMAVLAYIIPPIPYFIEKENNYVKFHARQGMDLLIVWILYIIIYNILTSLIRVNTSCGSIFGYDLGQHCKTTPWWVTGPLGLIGLSIFIIFLMGIIYAATGKAKDLPFINKFKLFK